MKKCRRCSKPATMHITEVRDAQAVAIHLCESCARDYLKSDTSEADTETGADLSAKLDELVSQGSEALMASMSCPACGITFAEFRESGRFGCPNDYSEFLAEILPLLENIHEDTRHIGKRPGRNSAAVQDQTQLIRLRNQLKTAVEQEDYETAAAIRDQIAALETAMRTGVPPASGS